MQRRKLVDPHAKHLVAVHDEFAVGRRQRVDAQQPVAAHRIVDGVVVAGRPEARDLLDLERRRALERLRQRLERHRHRGNKRGGTNGRSGRERHATGFLSVAKRTQQLAECDRHRAKPRKRLRPAPHADFPVKCGARGQSIPGPRKFQHAAAAAPAPRRPAPA